MWEPHQVCSPVRGSTTKWNCAVQTPNTRQVQSALGFWISKFDVCILDFHSDLTATAENFEEGPKGIVHSESVPRRGCPNKNAKFCQDRAFQDKIFKKHLWPLIAVTIYYKIMNRLWCYNYYTITIVLYHQFLAWFQAMSIISCNALLSEII